MLEAKTSINKQGKGKEQRDNKRSLKNTLLIKYTTGRVTLKKTSWSLWANFFHLYNGNNNSQFSGVFWKLERK